MADSIRSNPDVQVMPGEKEKAHISLRYLIRNIVSMMGLAGVAFFGQVLLILIVLDLTGVLGSENLYSGLITYVLLPVLFSASVVVLALGMLWKWWRTRKHGMEMTIVPGHTPAGRAVAISVAAVITVAWIFVAAYGTYKGYHYTDSTVFCGMACHQVMEPEYTAYQHSPHSRVNCVECHIGAGADFFVKAKLSGLRQVWHTYNGTFKTPIETPVKNLRPARDTCEHCHSPSKFSNSVERVFTHYSSDDTNTPVRYDMLMKVGGGNSNQATPTGVHWHVSDSWQVKYLPMDEKRQQIPYVRVTYKDGRVEEFITADFDRTKLSEDKLRIMDCMDCHSRPAHTFHSPNQAINDAMDKGLISPTLPGIKRAAMKIFKEQYKTKADALVAIDAAMDAYATEQKLAPEQSQLLADARVGIKNVYSTNFFPEQGVDYRAFINNIGHFEFKGCERCHDGKHLSANGAKRAITHKCDACHLLIGQANGVENVKKMTYGTVEFEHPEDPVNLNKSCSSCHALKKE